VRGGAGSLNESAALFRYAASLRLAHCRNIAAPLAACRNTADARLYIVSEHCDGGRLSALLHDLRLDEAFVAHFGKQVSSVTQARVKKVMTTYLSARLFADWRLRTRAVSFMATSTHTAC
jgi:hypothetical protein